MEKITTLTFVCDSVSPIYIELMTKLSNDFYRAVTTLKKLFESGIDFSQIPEEYLDYQNLVKLNSSFEDSLKPQVTKCFVISEFSDTLLNKEIFEFFAKKALTDIKGADKNEKKATIGYIITSKPKSLVTEPDFGKQ